MVDSCFKVFRAKCFRKPSLKSLRDSRESFFENDKNAINNSISHDKKIYLDTNSTSIDNDKKAKADNAMNELEHQHELEIEPQVILRRPNRLYLRSISSNASNDVISSDDEEDENLDVLYPLPHVNNNDYSPTEEAIRKIYVDKNDGEESEYKYFLFFFTHVGNDTR